MQVTKLCRAFMFRLDIERYWTRIKWTVSQLEAFFYTFQKRVKIFLAAADTEMYLSDCTLKLAELLNVPEALWFLLDGSGRKLF